MGCCLGSTVRFVDRLGLINSAVLALGLFLQFELINAAFVALGLEICRALAYIHNSIGVCHRDIKPQNLLVNPHTHQVKLCDFGSAKVLVKGEPNISYICSRYYRAPELIFGATEYNSAIDIWSAGCVLAELLLGQMYEPIYAKWTSERCAVCRWIEDWDDNKIIICNRCQIVVHQECYGVRNVQGFASWVCRACESPEECCLCPVKALGEQLVFISIGCLHDIHGKTRETSATPPADGLNTYHFIPSTKLCLLTTQPCTGDCDETQ